MHGGAFMIKSPFILQGDRQFVELMEYIFTEVNNNKTKGPKPWVQKIDVLAEDIDGTIASVPGDAPKLYLFFKGNDFKLAEVGADTCQIHLQAADVLKALMTYVATYFAFHVGYPEKYRQFLAFVQGVFLGIKYDGKKSVGHTALLYNFEHSMEEFVKLKEYKKYCV